MPEYRFDEIAICSKEKKKPTEEDKYTYIGLEHLDAGSLTVTRWGSEIAPTGEKLVMQKGDVLFGKRRAYQKKVAIAPFNGIFSAHGMVLRPRENVITSDFFPLFISSDYFLDEAIKISVGSLSPTINWSDLKELKFQIPTIDEQKRLAPMIWAAIDTKNAYQKLLSSIDELVKSQFIEMFGDASIGEIKWKKLTVRDAIAKGYIDRPLDGNHGEKHPKGDDYVTSGVPFIMAQDLKDKHVDFSGCHFITEKQAKTLKKGWAKTGDVLLTHKGTIGRVAVVQPSEYTDMLLTPQITYYRCLKDLDNEYLAAYFATDYFIKQLQSMITGTTRASVTITQQENLELIIPPMEMQHEFVAFVQQSDKSKFVAYQTTITQLFTCMIRSHIYDGGHHDGKYIHGTAG